MSRNAYFEKSSKRNGRGQVLRIQWAFREAWALPALTVAKTWLSERVAIPSSRHEREHSGKKTRVISLFLLSVRWTFFFPREWKLKAREKIHFRDFVFDSIVWNQLDFIRNKFQVFGKRRYVTTTIELKIISFRGMISFDGVGSPPTRFHSRPYFCGGYLINEEG